MKLIIQGRATSKTYDCLQKMKSNPQGLMIVPDGRQHKVKLENPDIADRILSISEYMHKRAFLHGYKDVYVDDLDLVLLSVFSQNITATLPSECVSIFSHKA